MKKKKMQFEAYWYKIGQEDFSPQIAVNFPIKTFA